MQAIWKREFVRGVGWGLSVVVMCGIACLRLHSAGEETPSPQQRPDLHKGAIDGVALELSADTSGEQPVLLLTATNCEDAAKELKGRLRMMSPPSPASIMSRSPMVPKAMLDVEVNLVLAVGESRTLRVQLGKPAEWPEGVTAVGAQEASPASQVALAAAASGQIASLAAPVSVQELLQPGYVSPLLGTASFVSGGSAIVLPVERPVAEQTKDA